MKTRCKNKNHVGFKNYGGRGISICREWENDFDKFLIDMGKRPSKKYSLERIDNDKGYSKENCKWILKKDQSKNRRTCIIFNGMTSNEASKKLGGSRYLVRKRLLLGWSIEKAFTAPLAFV